MNKTTITEIPAPWCGAFDLLDYLADSDAQIKPTVESMTRLTRTMLTHTDDIRWVQMIDGELARWLQELDRRQGTTA